MLLLFPSCLQPALKKDDHIELSSDLSKLLSSDLSKLHGMSFAGLDICSLNCRLEDIHLILTRKDLDCLCLSESWLNASMSTGILGLESYTVH